MPQSTPELQAEWGDDSTAVEYLKAAGYRLNRDWSWSLLDPLQRPTVKEIRAITYLIQEWDFAWLTK